MQGLSEGMSNAEVDKQHQLFLAAFERHFKSSPSHFLQLLNVTKTQTHAFLNLFSNSIAAKGNSDCHLQMSPRSQMLCHLWAAHVHPADSNTPSSLFSEVPLNSLCSLYMSCISWRRGCYSTRLSVSLLESTFNTMRADARLSHSSRLLRRNFVHGIGNTAENDWLTQRLQTSHDVLSTAAGGTVDVRPVFQGGEMTLLDMPYDNADDGSSTTTMTTSFAFRDNGDAVFEQTAPLTVLQTLSILYHRAAGDTSVKVHFPLLHGSGGGGACLVPPLNVLLFSGDSVNHELYRRLLDAIRNGVGPVQVPFSGNGSRRLRTNFSFWPAHDLPNGPDRILAVYPTHDDYFDVHCEMENDVLLRGGKPDKTTSISRYFYETARKRAASYCSGDGDAVEHALFYLVFLRDPITTTPRTPALAPCVPPQRFVGEFPPRNSLNYYPMVSSLSKNNQSRFPEPRMFLRTFGVRIGMHVHGSNIWEFHPSPNTYAWLTRMATDCRMAGPLSVGSEHNASTLTHKHRSNNSTSDREELWTFGEHPRSDHTVLFLTTPPLWEQRQPRTVRVAPLAKWTWSGGTKNRKFVNNGNRHLARLLHPFHWMNSTVRAVHQQHPDDDVNASPLAGGVFFQSVRVLDHGKAHLSTSKRFATRDGLHETCIGADWLVGVADGVVLKEQATTLTKAFVAHFGNFPNILKFDQTACGGFGLTLTLTAMLLDILYK